MSLGPSRQKFWSEINDQEKLQRSREVIKQLQLQVANLVATVTRLQGIVERHQHGVAGEVLVPAQSRESGAMLSEARARSGSGDECYF